MLKHLMKSHLTYGSNERKLPESIIDGIIKLFSHSCNNKNIRFIFQSKFFLNALIVDIHWKEAWLNPYKFCMLNKVKEVHFKILHKIYPCKALLSKFMDIDNKCSFCNVYEEDLAHLFYECELSQKFWSDVSHFLFAPRKINYKLSLKDVIHTEASCVNMW